jgi:hypothetical protein
MVSSSLLASKRSKKMLQRLQTTKDQAKTSSGPVVLELDVGVDGKNMRERAKFRMSRISGLTGTSQPKKDRGALVGDWKARSNGERGGPTDALLYTSSSFLSWGSR